MNKCGVWALVAVLGALNAAPVPAPTLLWERDIIGYCDKPTVADLDGSGRLQVVCATDEGYIYALGGPNGVTLWERKYEGQRFLACPIVADVDGSGVTSLLLTSLQGLVICLKGTDGSEAWRLGPFEKGTMGCAALADLDGDGKPELLFTTGSYLYAVHAADGKEVWKATLPHPSRGSVSVGAVAGPTPVVLAGTDRGELVCLDHGGKPYWVANIGGRVTKAPLLVDADKDGNCEIYAVGGDLVRLDEKGTKIWTWSPPSGSGLASALAAANVDGSGKLAILAGGLDGCVHAVQPDGKPLWRYALVPPDKQGTVQFVPSAVPAALDLRGRKACDVLVTSPRSDLPGFVAIDGKTGKLLYDQKTANFTHCCAVLADLCGDRTVALVDAVAEGKLHCFRLGPTSTEGWVKFAGDLGNTNFFANALRDGAALLAGKSPFETKPQTVNWADKVPKPAPPPEPTPTTPTATGPGAEPPKPAVLIERPKSPIAVKLNGIWLPLDPAPLELDGRVMVPLRGLFEALNATVKFDRATKLVVATKGAMVLQLTLGSKTARLGDYPMTLDVAPQELNGAIYVPLRFAGQALGVAVKWLTETKDVELTANP